jgi:hypothetical protein
LICDFKVNQETRLRWWGYPYRIIIGIGISISNIPLKINI